jgi:hypothetical protein
VTVRRQDESGPISISEANDALQNIQFRAPRAEALADDSGRAIFPKTGTGHPHRADMKERAMSKAKIKWKNEPETEDYEGAKNFLTLICSDAEALKLIEHLHKSDTTERAAKDLLRAADLPLLDESDPHVREDLKRIQKGTPLPPVLLVRGEMKKGNRLIIADGYHRICAVYSCDESAFIQCRMATWSED